MASASVSVRDLPSELLLDIFDSVSAVSKHDARATYANLSNAALVCRQWRSATNALLSRVEVAKKDDARLLLQSLNTRDSLDAVRGNAVKDLVLGVGAPTCNPSSTALNDSDDFHAILSQTPLLQKLVVLHHNTVDPITDSTRPLPHLPHLTHVTVASASVLASPCLETNLLQQLPSSVRYLSLPGPERSRIWGGVNTVGSSNMKKLKGLAIQEWPSPTSKWLGAGSSMKELSVVYLSKAELVAESYPHLTSLRILGRIGQATSAHTGFSGLTELERLEIRDMTAVNVVGTLQPSLKSIRFWSPKMATELTQAIMTRSLPNLEEVVYDWFVPKASVALPSKATNTPSPTDRMRQAFRDSVNALKQACQMYGIKLTLVERVDSGRCGGSLQSWPKPQTSQPIPARLLSTMISSPLSLQLAPHFQPLGAGSPGRSGGLPGCWSPIWEDVFEGHASWVLEADAMRRSRALPSPNQRMQLK
ncbi:hypothetical protein FRB96_006545 [Tulasnella sp. 330]|nr:hypothetical protein FRB96_006545 [Tulasnella sp. 330]KAG8878637.1 hypothetical protein FRB98_006026 [Tulasnella sp. 332]